MIPYRVATDISDTPPTYGGKVFHAEMEFGKYATRH